MRELQPVTLYAAPHNSVVRGLGEVSLSHAYSFLINLAASNNEHPIRYYKIGVEWKGGIKILTAAQFIEIWDGTQFVSVGDVFLWPERVSRPSNLPRECRITRLEPANIQVKGNDVSQYIKPTIMDHTFTDAIINSRLDRTGNPRQ